MTEALALDLHQPSEAFECFSVDKVREAQARIELTAYLESIGQWNLQKNVEELLSPGGGFLDRLNFIAPLLLQRDKAHLLVSGCSVGSELIIARNFGFRKAEGTEVVEEYVSIGRSRVAEIPDTAIHLYDGQTLPFQDESFSMVASGHIIEHTPSPYQYFVEHLRVLKKGGLFFLEFPNRYHSVELHTGLSSYEWLPKFVRDVILRWKSSPLSSVPEREKKLFEAVLTTLQPISVWQLQAYLLLSGHFRSKVIARQIPAPGFMRVLIRK